MGFRDAVSAVPAKPIMAFAVAITAMAAAWHGWTLHSICTGRADLTAALESWAKEAKANPTQAFDLEGVTDKEWTQIRISQGLTTLGPSQNCPFDWHWSNQEREAMAQAGNLTLIGFFNQDRLIEIADFDRQWARFATDDQPIDRQDARFKVTQNNPAQLELSAN
ncbi:hypothetical protein ACTL6U_10785 [Rhodovibrionaceae bacterium A322]